MSVLGLVMLSLFLLVVCVLSVQCLDASDSSSCKVLETRVQDLEKQLQHLTDIVTRQQAPFEKHNASPIVRRQEPYDTVAFTAGVARFDVANLPGHQTIVFDKVLTNVGNAYDGTSGVFVAPTTGVYMFIITLQVNANHSEYLELVVDGSKINDVYADATNTNDNMSTTKNWILVLNQGSRVWARTTSYENQGEIHGNMHTMFSGFRIVSQ